MKYLFVLLMLLASCCRFIPQRCITNTTDTLTVVRVDTLPPVYRDTIIYRDVLIPGETVRDSFPVFVGRDGLVNSDTLKMEVDLAEAWAVVENSILKGELVQKDTLMTLTFRLDSALRETTILRDSIAVINNTTTLIKKQHTRISWIMGGVIIILLLILLLRIMRH